MSQFTSFSRQTPSSVSTHSSVIPPGMVSVFFQSGLGQRTIESDIVISKTAFSLVPQVNVHTTKLAITKYESFTEEMKRMKCYRSRNWIVYRHLGPTRIESLEISGSRYRIDP